MLSAVLFDLDDTLCDTIGCREPRIRHAVEDLKVGRPTLATDAIVASALAPTAAARDIRGLRAALEDAGVLADDELSYALRLFDTHFEPLRLFPGVPEVLRRLAKRYHLGVVTNSDGDFQRSKLEALGLHDLFDSVTVSHEVGYAKPDSRIFLRAAEELNVSPTEAVFVGDRLDVDIAGAASAGMKTVWFNHWGGELGLHDHPDAVITDFRMLSMALEVL